MKVKDIIMSACRYMHIQLPDCCHSSKLTVALADQLQYNTVLINLLMCLDTVLSEMNSIVPNIVVADVEVADGMLSADSLPSPMLEVIRLTDNSGYSVPYRYMAGGLLVDGSGSMHIVYSTPYAKCSYLGDINIVSGKIDHRVLTHALCSEYCLLEGDYDNFTMWESRYRNGLPSVTHKCSSINMPTRGWY